MFVTLSLCFAADIDECVNSTLCHDELAVCVNTIGNYTCDCIVGYEGNGVNFCNGRF